MNAWRKTMPRLGAWLVLGASFAATAPADRPASIDQVTDWSARKATVLFFLYTDCPIANNYAPEMERICQHYRDKGVTFFRVYPADGVDDAAAARHGHDYNLSFPAVLDPKGALVKLAGARVTPTAVVFDSTGKRRYLGRIDDRYVELGKYRPEATRHDLCDALDAMLTGKEVATPETTAVGCILPDAATVVTSPEPKQP